jgi:hypothetical protein
MRLSFSTFLLASTAAWVSNEYYYLLSHLVPTTHHPTSDGQKTNAFVLSLEAGIRRQLNGIEVIFPSTYILSKIAFIFVIGWMVVCCCFYSGKRGHLDVVDEAHTQNISRYPESQSVRGFSFFLVLDGRLVRLEGIAFLSTSTTGFCLRKSHRILSHISRRSRLLFCRSHT